MIYLIKLTLGRNENVFFCGDGVAITRDWVCDCDDCSDE